MLVNGIISCPVCPESLANKQQNCSFPPFISISFSEILAIVLLFIFFIKTHIITFFVSELSSYLSVNCFVGELSRSQMRSRDMLVVFYLHFFFFFFV